MAKLRVCNIYSRGIHAKTVDIVYGYVSPIGDGDVGRELVCGRQVIPTSDSWPTDMRHGSHSPLHDLMVLRLKEGVKFVQPVPPVIDTVPDFRKWSLQEGNFAKINLSPIRTISAKPDDQLYRDEMKFASLGHLNGKHNNIEKARFLELGEFGNIVDCEE